MEKSLSNALEVFIRFWEHSSEPWIVKDNQSRYVYANHRFNRLCNLPDRYCVEGLLDGEIPMPSAEFQDEFQRQDRLAELLQDRIMTLEINEWDSLSYLTPFFADRYPLIDENGVSQGVIIHGRPVHDTILTHLNIKLPISITFTPPSQLLTKREWEVLFYILHHFSSNEISKKVHLSPRSVCNITQNIYRKAGVTSKKQIIEYCHEQNIHNYVPQSIFEYSGSFPLAG
ncbi:helix-turn-helix transcriptional regulator [Yersinia aldovae]|uniref:helix-turn-helix transcriptional regulator n=1 Tax=Yersinia aldovae TaxID=29483 RepID=UPI0005ABFB1F|nr:LuxR C-terminal-related transcriptional regulator [Yersinia aldovae]AJJ64471.1 bacterial regulatory s, luxR family protein [Yersinia aldovae 670-83]